MQLIINKLKFAIIISFFVVSQIDCRMLDVWIGADTTETPDSEFIAITSSFELGLCLKSFPMIATNQLVYNMLKRNLEGKIKISFDDFDIYKTDRGYLFIPHAYKTKIESSLPKQFKELLAKYKSGKELALKETDKEFIKYHQDIIKALKQYTPEEIILGFCIDPNSYVFDNVDKSSLTSSEYIENINRSVPFSLHSINSIKQMFVKGKGDFFGLWNVVLEGHGEYPKDVKMNLTMNSIVNQLGQEGNISGESGMMIAGLWLPRFRDFIQFLTNDINVNFLYYSTCYSGDLNMILPYITTLLNIRAGLENVKMFGKKEETLIKESIIPLASPNFTIANGALTSQYVYRSGEDSMAQCKKLSLAKKPKSTKIQMLEAQETSDYTKFFNLLNKYSKDKAGNEANVSVKYNNEELRDILSAITARYSSYLTSASYLNQYDLESIDDPYGILALPSVMFPGTEKFVAIALDDKTVVLSNVLVEKYKKENKSFNLEDKKAILIYPKEISPEIKIIKKNLPLYPSIVSMIPGLSLHKIDNLKIEVLSSDTANEILDTFIKDSFTKIKPASPKYFYIKQLSIKKDKKIKGKIDVFNDVFIRSQVDQDYVYINISPVTGSINVSGKRPGKIVLENKKKVEAVPDNSFLNSIYNYFILNPKIGEEFKFDDIKSLLTKEELDILNSVKKEDIKIEEAKVLTPTAMKAKAVREKILAAAKAKAAKAKAKKAAAMKAKAIREKVLAAARARAAKTKAEKAADKKAKSIRDKALAEAESKAAEVKAGADKKVVEK